MELYTSLVRLKQEMNDGQLPPMTPVPESVHHIIDPAFTIGLGALHEDAVLGLRCPVRGCGVYRQRLRRHIRAKHAAIGGVPAVLDALSIPQSVSLISARLRGELTARIAPWSGKTVPFTAATARAAGRKGGLASHSRTTTGARNLINSCKRQLSHRIIDLHNELHRSPTGTEFQSKYGATILTRVVRVFGSWSNAKSQCGLEVYRRRKVTTSADVLPSLRAWHARYGSLPSAADATQSSRLPLLHSYRTILLAFGADSWPEAMRRAAALLNIYGGRYGLPEKEKRPA